MKKWGLRPPWLLRSVHWYLPTFRDSLSVPSSRVNSPRNLLALINCHLNHSKNQFSRSLIRKSVTYGDSYLVLPMSDLIFLNIDLNLILGTPRSSTWPFTWSFRCKILFELSPVFQSHVHPFIPSWIFILHKTGQIENLHFQPNSSVCNSSTEHFENLTETS
jgi:hypothetical protein